MPIDSEQIEQIKNLESQKVPFKKDSVVQGIKFASYKTPVFKERLYKNWINCGPDNLWPLYLISIMNNCAMHKRIILSKVKQIVGEGLTVEDSQDSSQIAEMNDFLKKIRFNKKTLKKIAYDQQLFNYWFLGITWNETRTKIANIFHVDASTIRVGIPNKETKEVDHFWYSEDWTQSKKQGFRPEDIPIYDPCNRTSATCLMMIREYEPATRFYSLPSYEGCRDSIELSYELSAYMLNSIKNGLSPSLNISFNNGEPTDEERETIYQTVNALYKGSQNAGKFLMSFNKSKDNATTVEPINVSNMSEIYASLGEYAQSQIIVGHGITSPTLCGVAIPGQLGNSASEMQVASELFYKQIVDPAQAQIEEVIQELLEVNGWTLKVFIKDCNPVSYEYDDATLMNIMTIDEMRARINLAPLSDFDKKNLAVNITNADYVAPADAPSVPGIAGAPSPTEGEMAAQPVNDNIKNLSGRQHGTMMRVIRQYSKGTLTKDAAATLLRTGLGLNEDDINSLLGDTEEEMDVQTPLSSYIKEVPSKKIAKL